MGIFFKSILLGCWFVMAMLLSAHCQTKFSAELIPAEINKDEYTTLRLTIENAIEIKNLVPPSLKDFIVVSGPNQESGMNSVNGIVTQYISFSYILQPRHAGRITLEKALAIVNGKEYTSHPIKLIVRNTTGKANRSNSIPSPFAAMDPFYAPAPKEEFNDFILKKGERVPDKVSRSIHLKLQTDKTSCYIGEPVIASYKLYTRLKSESNLTKNPSFNGFSVIDLMRPDVTDYSREKVNGREYNVYTIRKAQLYPLQDGIIELETATLQNSIQFLKEDAKDLQGNVDGFLNGFSLSEDAFVTETVSLSSKPVSITVKPLPDKGKPLSFNGAVGKYDITASLEKNNFTADETGKLTLEVSGAGNLQLVTSPDIKWPQQLEPFDVKVTEDLLLLDVPVSGRKIFEIPFTVQAKGNYEIPSIEFSFFNPATGTYKTLHTKPIAFSVKEGTANKTFYGSTPAIKKEEGTISKWVFKQRGFAIVGIALIMALVLLVWLKQDKKKNKTITVQNKIEPNGKEEQTLHYAMANAAEPQNPLQLAEECLHTTECNEFYSILNQELKTYLSHRFSIPVQEINVKKILAAMDVAGIDNEIALQIQQLIKDIEWQLFTPFERNESMNELYNRAQSLLQLIQTYHLAPTL